MSKRPLIGVHGFSSKYPSIRNFGGRLPYRGLRRDVYGDLSAVRFAESPIDTKTLKSET